MRVLQTFFIHFTINPRVRVRVLISMLRFEGSGCDQLPACLEPQFSVNCYGIAEVMCSSPVHCLHFNFTNARVMCIIVMTNRIFIFFLAVQIYGLSHIYLFNKNTAILSENTLEHHRHRYMDKGYCLTTFNESFHLRWEI